MIYASLIKMSKESFLRLALKGEFSTNICYKIRRTSSELQI